MSAAHTFLQKNPEDPYLTKNMNYYKSLSAVDAYLIDHEQQRYEVPLDQSMLYYLQCFNETQATSCLVHNVTRTFLLNTDCFMVVFVRVCS